MKKTHQHKLSFSKGKPRKKLVASLLTTCLFSSAMLLSACGGGSGGSSNPSPSPSPSPTPTPTPQAGSLDLSAPSTFEPGATHNVTVAVNPKVLQMAALASTNNKVNVSLTDISSCDPKLTIKPASQQVSVGDNAVFTVTAPTQSCAHRLKATADGLEAKEQRLPVVPGDITASVALQNNAKEAITDIPQGKSGYVIFTHNGDWGTVNNSQTYTLTTDATGITFNPANGQCSISGTVPSCQVEIIAAANAPIQSNTLQAKLTNDETYVPLAGATIDFNVIEGIGTMQYTDSQQQAITSIALTVSSSTPETITLKNDGVGDIKNIQVNSGTDSDKFAISNDQCSGQSIAPNNSCSFDLLLANTVTETGQTYVLQASADNAENSPIALDVTTQPQGVMSFFNSDGALALPVLAITHLTPTQVTLKATTSAIQNIQLNTGANSDKFTVTDNTCSDTLNQDQSCTFKVQLANDEALGTLTTFEVSADDAANSPITLSTVATIGVAKTGQTATTPFDPAPAGSDGALQKGVAWPEPRFVEATDANGNPCSDALVDQVTGLMWPKNGIIGFKDGGGNILTQPDYTNATASLNQVTWSNALTAISNMNSATTKLCGYSDWHLPNILEQLSITNINKANSATWLNTQGFENIQVDTYWTGSTYANGTSSAWGVNLESALTGASGKTSTNIATWPVRETN
ncbi:Lcl C-terminal domain-containing protein [Facilibium subflavum]|uniref:Lcl C-terminal domain-containing protein n=1 Tax=Facilibium subflavum TaxID=2219058 RepID=UPI000E65B93F|nr:DUF1566 domain-containing protein [Facilibium subflavum]